MELKIVIPSHKRPDRVNTTSAVEGCILCVAESQKPAYLACNKGIEIVTHPDSVIGLARKRDWIIKYFGDVFMLDDDITHLGRVYSEKGEESEVDPTAAADIIRASAQACQDAGFFVFGFSNSPKPLVYNPMKPIELKGYVTGCGHGVLKGSKLWYNPEIICNEDYWISLLNAFFHRGIWKDTRFYLHQRDTFVNRGGLAEFRNVDAEEKDFLLLQKVFGKDVINLRRKQFEKTMKHPYQKSMTLPF